MEISGLGCGEAVMDQPPQVLALTSTSGLMEVFHHLGKSVKLLLEKVSWKEMEGEMPGKSSVEKEAERLAAP